MQATSEHTTTPLLHAPLEEGELVGEWVLDPHRSSIRLAVPHLWSLAPVSGAFREISGHARVSPNGEVSGTVTIAAASIDTNNIRRDTHLRSKAFLDSENYPDITYTPERIHPSRHGVAVTGTVTVRDRTRTLSFDAVASVRGDGEISLDAEVSINRADFGLTWNVLGIPSMNITLTIHATFTQR